MGPQEGVSEQMGVAGAMKWCPKCGTEYRDEFDVCADCKVPLSDMPPDPSSIIKEDQQGKQLSALYSALRLAGLILALIVGIPFTIALTLQGQEKDVLVFLYPLMCLIIFLTVCHIRRLKRLHKGSTK